MISFYLKLINFIKLTATYFFNKLILNAHEEIVRKIVIFATDVVNYSKHMEIDESETVKSLRFYEKILKALFKKYNGNLFNSGGDSFMANSLALLMQWSALSSFKKR